VPEGPAVFQAIRRLVTVNWGGTENPVMQKYKNIESNARQKLRSGVGGMLPKFPGVTGIIDPEG
jgi:hypothetical protein